MIGIMGYGIVGKAIANSFQSSTSIVKYDKYISLDDSKELLNCDFVFISVPTPFDVPKNKIDDSSIIECLSILQNMNYNGVVIIKSTLPPGYTNRFISEYNLHIVYNPEFLRESTTPNADFQNQHTVVIGTDDISLYNSTKKLFETILDMGTVYYKTSIIEAEMIKCSQNTMLASRVILANMIFDACEENGVDYTKIREIAFDRFDILGPSMVQVPGPDGKRGFGGKCLPKDIRAFSTIHKSDLLDSIIKYNDSLRDDLDNFLVNFKDK